MAFHKKLPGDGMRIGMFAWESLYSIKVGGIASHVSEVSEAMAKEGHEVHVFTRRGDFDQYDCINAVHYQRVNSDSSGSLLYQMDRMCDALYDRFIGIEKIFGKFDILHGHDWHPVPALIKLKKEFGYPYILTIHSTERGRGGSFQEISRREHHGMSEASRVVVTSKRMLDEATSVYAIPASKVIIVPNGINGEKIKKGDNPAKVRKRHEIRQSSKIVLFCGRMVHQKGPDMLVEAVPQLVKKFKDLVFVFAGEGNLMTDCVKRAKKLDVIEKCRFLGYVTESEKWELLNACDIVCIPSRYEPFGLIILEAWNAGKPVVATEAVSIIKNFEDGLLAYVQPESLAWCINRLLENPEEMKKLARAGNERIKTEFSWNTIAKSTEAIYKSILQ
jgi:glycosyltransferase involved in cell wall biosynthesis